MVAASSPERLSIVASWGLGGRGRALLDSSGEAVRRALESGGPMVKREGERVRLAAMRVREGAAVWAMFDPPRRLSGGQLAVLRELASAAHETGVREGGSPGESGPAASPQEVLSDTLSELMLSHDSTVGTYLVQDGRISDVNEQLARVLGYEREALIGRDVLSIAHPGDRDLIRENMRKRLEGVVDRSVYTFRALTGTGRIVHLEAHGARLDLDGAPAIGGIVVDVSRRVRAQHALRASERRFAEIVALSRDATMCVDDEGAVVLFNPAAESFFGVSVAEVIGSPVVELMPELAEPGSGPGETGRGSRLVEGERPDGSPFAAEIWSTSGTGETEDLRVVVVRDVTHQRRRETEGERLLELERDQRRIAEAAQARAQFVAEVTQALSGAFGEPDRVLRLLPELAVPLTSDYAICYRVADGGPEPVAFSAVDSAVRNTLAGSPPALPELDWAASPEGWACTATEPGPGPVRELYEAHRRRFNARRLDVVPLNDDGVRAVLVFGRHRDQGRDDDGDAELGRELASRASTALMNARLYQEARAATQLREQVLAVVSHDLRSPLEVIALTADSLIRHWPPHPTEAELTRDQLELMQRSAKRMNRLVRDLVEVAQIEKGVMAVDPMPCDPGELLREAYMAHQPVAEEKGIRMVFDRCDEGAPAYADPERVLQVLGNLLDNAFRHGPPDSTVHLRCIRREGAVRVEVSDEGEGIAPEDRTGIFEHFSRGQGRSWGLAGLGLAIARGIVEAHGGELDVESEVGQGATFYFTLPCTEPTPTPAEPEYQLQA